MSTAQRIVRNASFLFTGQVLSMAFSFAFVLALARILGDVALGQYSFAFAFASMFLIFSDLGLSPYMVKEVAKNKARAASILGTVFSLKFVLLLGFAAVMIAAIMLTAQSKETVQIVSIVMLATFFNFLTEPLRNTFIAFERQEYYAAMLVFERAASSLGGIIALWMTHSLIPVLWVFVATYALSLLITGALVLTRFTRFTPVANVQDWITTIRNAWPFWFSLLFMAVYYRVDTIMLSAMTNYAVVGWYNAAYKMVEALSFIPLIVVSAVFPAMSRFHLESRHLLHVLYEKVMYYMLVIAMPLAVGVTLTAQGIIGIAYLPAFTPAVIALQLLIWSELFIFLNYVIGYLLNAIDKQKLFTLATAAYLGVNVILNWLLIPHYGHAGAAGVTVATQLIGFITLYVFASRKGYPLNLARLAFKPAVAVAVMAITILTLHDLHVLLVIAAATTTYLGTLLLVKGIGSEEMELLKNLLPFKARR